MTFNFLFSEAIHPQMSYVHVLDYRRGILCSCSTAALFIYDILNELFGGYICFSRYLFNQLFYNNSYSLPFFFVALVFYVIVVGIIKRKALIRQLATVYHEECLLYCQELLELQKKWEEVRCNIMYSTLALFDSLHRNCTHLTTTFSTCTSANKLVDVSTEHYLYLCFLVRLGVRIWISWEKKTIFPM